MTDLVKIGLPPEVWDAVLVCVFILVAHAGLTAFNFLCKKEKIEHDNAVAGILFGVITLIYSLIIAFVIIAVWENYEELNQTMEKEAEDLNTVLVHSNMLPDSLRKSVTVAIRNYCQRVVNKEWGASEEHIRLEGSAMPGLRLLLFRAREDSQIQQSIVTVLGENLTNITRLRQERLSHTDAYVPGLVWAILIIDSILVIFFSYFLFMHSERLKRIFLSFLWGMMATSLFLIYMLDHPFRGRGHVSKEPYELIIKMLSDQ